MGPLFRFTRALLGPASLLIYLATILFWINSAMFTSKGAGISYQGWSLLPGGGAYRLRGAGIGVNDGGILLYFSDVDTAPGWRFTPLSSRHFIASFGDDPVWFIHRNTSFWPTMDIAPGPWAVGWDWQLGVPIWIVCVLSMISSAIWLARLRRRFPPGSCQKCGYDLRATPSLCPECGSIPEKPLIPYNPPRSIS
jgi:hypothetical protein